MSTTINVTTVELAPPLSRDGIPISSFEGTVTAYVIDVETVTARWREQYTDPERVRAFIRGVKAGYSLLSGHIPFTVHVEQPEWNV